ncbi:hypothetical protein D915_005092 [Fasciola hepatica]|uniref:Low-density lipoprotein receptor domain class A n=1 Tax=Fasciola hepatica TaxID=6192 RepID=A0A4E0RYJ6_FASHE|nr:hypothetical protein D915_005092 [Fasciola hepatica]
MSSQVDIQMSAYMRFEGTFSIADKIERCEAGSGFWCGNMTAVCVYGQMRCDQADGCFDGGTDEIGCPAPRNYTLSPPRRIRSAFSVYLPWTALGIIPLILLFVLGLICTPRKTLDDYADEDEMDALKIHSPSSPLSSSTNSSASLVSEADSLKSVHSVLVLSYTPCSQSNCHSSHMVHQHNHRRCQSVQCPVGLPRWSSQPDRLARESAPRNSGCSSCMDHGRPSTGRTVALVQRSAFRDTTKSISSPRAVSFQLPSRPQTTVESSLKQQLQVRVLHSYGSSTTDLSTDTISVARSSVNADIHSGNPPEPVQSGRKDGCRSADIRGVENKSFALPAHLELPTLQLRPEHLSLPDPRRRNETPDTPRLSKKLNGTHHRDSADSRTKRFPASKVKSKVDELPLSRPISGLSSSGLSLSNVSNTSSNTTESDREDCTPFRRPDKIGHDPLSVKQQLVVKCGSNPPNGFLPEIVIAKTREVSSPRAHTNNSTIQSDYIVL